MAVNPVSLNHLMYEYDDVLVSTNLDYTLCYQFEGVPLYGQSIGEYKRNVMDVMDAINQLDEGIRLSFLIRNKPDSGDVLNHYLSHMNYDEKRKGFIKKTYQGARAIEKFAYFTAPRNQKILPSFFPGKVFQKSNDENHKKYKEKLTKNSSRFIKSFEKIGCAFKLLSLDEVGKLSFYHLNGTEASDIKLHKDIFYTQKNGKIVKSQPTIREQVLMQPMTFHDRCIQIGDDYIGILSIDTLGDFMDVGFYDRLNTVLPENYEIIINIEKLNKEKADKQFTQGKQDSSAEGVVHKSNESTFQSSKISSKNVIVRDQETMMLEVNSHNLEVFKLNVSISIRCKSEKEVVDTFGDVKKALQSSKFHYHLVSEAGSMTAPYFHGFLPGNGHQLKDDLILHTLSLLYYIPVNEFYKGYSRLKPLGRVNQIYLTPLNEIVMYHNFYFGANYRIKEITATTGSGKTLDLNKEIDGVMSEKVDENNKPIVIAVEPKRGFSKVTKKHNGVVISCNPSSPDSYNPFPYKKDLYLPKEIDYEGFEVTEDIYDPMLMDYFVNLLGLLVREDKHPTLSPRMKGVIANIIRRFYDNADEDGVMILPDIHGAIDSYRKEGEPKFNEELSRIKGNLERYLAPEYKNLFQIRTPLNLNSDIVYFDLSALEENEELKSMWMYLMGSSMIRKLRVKNRPTYLFLDEASIFYKTDIGATLLDYFVRQSRSLGGFVGIGTQSALDKKESKANDIVSENLSVRKCLYLEKGHERLKEVGFNEAEIPIIKSLKKKPGFFVEQYQNMNNTPMTLISKPDPYLYWLSTNDEKDDALFLKVQTEHKEKPFSEIISILAERYPNGAYAA